MKITIYLISGAPCTGKTIIARELSNKLKIPWISTDFIRSWMQNLVSRKDHPNLFNFMGSSAEEYYKKHSIKEAINHEKKRDKEVFKGVQKFIEQNEEWDSFIIEGISLHPKFIKNLKIKHKIKFVCLIDKDEKRIREIVYKRGLWGDAKTYSDWIKELEIKYLVKVNEYYLEECKKNNLKYFIIDKNISKTKKKVKEYLLK